MNNQKYIQLYKVKLVKDKKVKHNPYGVKLATSEHAVYVFKKLIKDSPSENILIMFLDRTNNIIGGIEEVAKGGIGMVTVTSREIFRSAISYNASALIIGHNHPSGDHTPSDEDIKFTENIIKCSKILQIPLIDHIIVSRNGHTSMFDQGLI